LKKILLILLLLGLIIGLLVGCNAVTPPVSGGQGEGESEKMDRVVLVECRGTTLGYASYTGS